jgi:hypothetical protein
MGITNKGKGWELRNSLWLIWAVIMPCIHLAFHGTAFLWIGLRARHRRWIFMACLYFLLGWLAPTLALGVFLEVPAIRDFLLSAFVIAWAVSIFHAILCRKEYLQRREMVVAKKEFERRQRAAQKVQPNSIEPPSPTSENKGRVVDL